MSKARNMARMGQDTSAGYTGAFDMPAGTTAERPASAGLGWTRLNTDTGSVEVYDGTNWNAVTRPFIASVSGTIYAGAASNLVIAGQNFTSTITVRFLEGGSTVADVTGVAVSSGSATVAVPAAVYGQTAGDSIEIKIINSDGTVSANGITKTVQALPTGGTITTSGGYRYHKFTSSGNFVAPSGFSATVDFLLVAGGGGGGNAAANTSGSAGGGGAGGLIQTTYGVTPNTYSVVIGAGAAGITSNSSQKGNNGNNSTLFGSTAVAGGAGANSGVTANNGGSGGGAGADGGGFGSGTAGQGNQGGQWATSAAGGGGGAGAAGQSGIANTANGNGGIGLQYSAWATATSSGDSGYYAGGGGSGGNDVDPSGASGGLGGGGLGGNRGSSPLNGADGAANTGGGGGASGTADGNSRYSGGGGSGIAIIRYAL